MEQPIVSANANPPSVSYLLLFLPAQLIPPPLSSTKTPVARGARACTVCRAAKVRSHPPLWRLSSQPAQTDEVCRCRGWYKTMSAMPEVRRRVSLALALPFPPSRLPPLLSCVFEKHRRGRKPGSK